MLCPIRSWQVRWVGKRIALDAFDLNRLGHTQTTLNPRSCQELNRLRSPKRIHAIKQKRRKKKRRRRRKRKKEEEEKKKEKKGKECNRADPPVETEEKKEKKKRKKEEDEERNRADPSKKRRTGSKAPGQEMQEAFAPDEPKFDPNVGESQEHRDLCKKWFSTMECVLENHNMLESMPLIGKEFQAIFCLGLRRCLRENIRSCNASAQLRVLRSDGWLKDTRNLRSV